MSSTTASKGNTAAMRATSAADEFLSRYSTENAAGDRDNHKKRSHRKPLKRDKSRESAVILNPEQLEAPISNENLIRRIRGMYPSPPSVNKPWAHKGGVLQAKHRSTKGRRTITPLKERKINVVNSATADRLALLAQPRKSRTRDNSSVKGAVETNKALNGKQPISKRPQSAWAQSEEVQYQAHYDDKNDKWEQILDPDSQCYYWYNYETGESQWVES